MQPSELILDLEFGLSQLSGNKTLFLRLLQKFSDEYISAEARIQQNIASGELDAARLQVHTIKGVAGNLGFTLLHASCRDAESELKAGVTPTESADTFFHALRVTLAEIQTLQENPALLDGPAPAASESVSTPASGGAPAAFISALKENEFIQEAQLEEWLNATTSDPAMRKAIKEAIDDLDYDSALKFAGQ